MSKIKYTSKDLVLDTRLIDEIRTENNRAELRLTDPIRIQRDALYSALNNLLADPNDINRNTALLVLYKVRLDMGKE